MFVEALSQVSFNPSRSPDKKVTPQKAKAHCYNCDQNNVNTAAKESRLSARESIDHVSDHQRDQKPGSIYHQ